MGGLGGGAGWEVDGGEDDMRNCVESGIAGGRNLLEILYYPESSDSRSKALTTGAFWGILLSSMLSSSTASPP